METVFTEVPLWAQYIGQDRFLFSASVLMKAVFRGAHKYYSDK